MTGNLRSSRGRAARPGTGRRGCAGGSGSGCRRCARPRRSRARRPSCRPRWRARTRSGGRRRGPLPAASAAASSSASSAGSQSSGSSSGSSSPSISTSADGQLLGRRRAAVGALRHLQLGGERDQRPRKGVDLVGVQRRAVGQVRLLVAEQPLEAEHQRIGAPPLDGWLGAAGLQLCESPPPGRPGELCPRRAPGSDPRPAARSSRARTPRRARGHRRRTARQRGQSLSQPRSAYS